MRKVFFSFHYARDIFRVSQVRNSWLFRPENQAQQFLDKADWEQVKRQGDQAIKDWIKEQMKGTTVTVVLIGNETSERPWVIHEIKESYNRRNGIIGIYIHNIKDVRVGIDTKGNNPFNYVWLDYPNGSRTYFSSMYPTYDWVINDGRNNIGNWIERAAQLAGK